MNRRGLMTSNNQSNRTAHAKWLRNRCRSGERSFFTHHRRVVRVENRLSGKQAPPEFFCLAHVVWMRFGHEVVETWETDTVVVSELGGTATAVQRVRETNDHWSDDWLSGYCDYFGLRSCSWRWRRMKARAGRRPRLVGRRTLVGGGTCSGASASGS